MDVVRIATRGSALAVAQAGLVARAVERALDLRAELVRVRTEGDRRQATSLAKIGGKGLFVKEVEATILEGRADMAVHSAKDLPAALAPGLALAAFPARGDARDALVGRLPQTSVDALRRGARVGTGSFRRGAQLLRRRPDLEIVPLRGNVETRLRKLESGDLDAVVLACAGLDRLGLAGRICERVAPEVLLPAVGQGTLAVQTRADGPLAASLCAVDDAATRACTLAERAFQAGLGGDCDVPLAAHAVFSGDGGELALVAALWSLDGTREIRVERRGRDPETLGRDAARDVRERGGDALLGSLRTGSRR